MGFAIAINFLALPFYIVKLDIVKDNTALHVILQTCLIVFYFPFAVLWASRAANLHPPTKKEAEKKTIEDRATIHQKIPSSGK